MASYYDTTSAATYVPAAIQLRDDFAALAARCEADLIRRYTRTYRGAGYHAGGRGYRGSYDSAYGAPWISTDGRRAVLLLYYHPDAADVDTTDADEQAFLDAFALELGRLIVWRAAQQDEDGNDRAAVKSESRGARSVTYNDGRTRSGFPPGFGDHLKPFALTQTVFAA